jgi:hypothetical protein
MGEEGFPATGVWRVRDANASASDDTNHTLIIDVALPADFGPDQYEALSSYPPSQETDMDSLGPDDFAQLPMGGILNP